MMATEALTETCSW